MKYVYDIVLRAGEECRIVCTAKIDIILTSGTLEVQGMTLESSQNYSFFLDSTYSTLALYTLEGGIGSVTSNHHFTVHRYNTKIVKITRLVRRLSSSRVPAAVLVIGNKKTGKSYISRTLYNSFTRYEKEKLSAQFCQSAFVDLCVHENQLYAPGCMSLIYNNNKPLLESSTNSPELVYLTFFVGFAQAPSTKTLSLYYHFVSQICESGKLFISENNTHNHDTVFSILDAPTPNKEINYEAFYKHLIEIVKPSHVVITGDREEIDNKWAIYLEEDIKRSEQKIEFLFVDLTVEKYKVETCREVNENLPQEHQSLLVETVTATATATKTTTNNTEITYQERKEFSVDARKLREYFVGNLEYPLLCSKIVSSTKPLQFVTFSKNEVTNAFSAANDVIHPHQITPDVSWRGLVCALSHAEIIEEVVLAPIAGLLLITEVNVVDDEITIIIPSSDKELLRRFIIVPSTSSNQTFYLPAFEFSIVEESTFEEKANAFKCIRAVYLNTQNFKKN